MGKKDPEFHDVDPEDLGEYAPVVYGQSHEEAEKYRQLLEDHDVPAVIDEDYEPMAARATGTVQEGVPVLVPESRLEEARGYIASIEEMGELVDDEDYLDGEDDENGYGDVSGPDIDKDENF